MTPHRRTILFINIGHFLDHYVMLIYPTAVLGMMSGGTAFGLGYGDLIALSTGSFVAFGLFALPAGWLADRWSRHGMMAVSFIGTGLAALACAVVWDALSLGVALTLLGVLAAIYHPVGAALLVATTDRLGRDIGRNGVAGNMGVAVAALATGALVDLGGWRTAFLVPGLVSLAAGILYLRLAGSAGKRGGPSRVPRFRVGHRDAILGFVLLTISGSANMLVFNGATIALPKLLDERVTWLAGSPGAIGLTAAAIVMVGAVAQLVVGRLVDRISIFAVGTVTAILAVPALLIAAEASGLALVLALAAVMISIFGIIVVNEALLACYVEDSWRGRAYALRFCVGFGFGGVAALLVGLLHEQFDGFGAVMTTMGGLAAVALACFLALPRPSAAPAEAPSAARIPAE